MLVPKKDGSLRFCVDYRKVNAITERDAYPLPNITEILESLSGAAIFSTIDLNSGYWQVTMDPESKSRTAFVTSSGLYEFHVMPFGLKNAPATFQRLMETVLEELRGKICFVYIDDIIIYSPSLTQHFHDLQTVLSHLQSAGFTINLKKSKFCLQELTFLGHVVSLKGVSADTNKVEAIRSYPVPKNLKEVQRFLGLAGWYHRFVPHFSNIAEPINALKKKGHKFEWTPQCQQAFNQLKSCLTSPPILGHPDLKFPFVVYTDASDTGLGAVITQQKEPGQEEVVAYASRALNKAETHYSTTEKECLAVVWALERWQHYLEPKLFTIVTDHSALQWVMNSTRTTSRLIRWALRLQKFDFVVEYRKGKLSEAPDALSRIHSVPGCHVYSTQEEEPGLPVSAIDIWEEQHKDPEITKLFQSLAEKDSSVQDQYEIIEDKLYHRTHLANGQVHYRIYVPATLIHNILQHYHAHPLSGHLGIYKTYQRVHKVAFWPAMWTSVKQYVKRCIKCQTLKNENRKPAGKIQQTTTRCWVWTSWVRCLVALSDMNIY